MRAEAREGLQTGASCRVLRVLEDLRAVDSTIAAVHDNGTLGAFGCQAEVVRVMNAHGGAHFGGGEELAEWSRCGAGR